MLDSVLDTALRELARRQHCVLSRAQARELGATREDLLRRLASPDWEALGPRVLRLAGSQETFRQRCMAAVLDAGSGAAVSHETAASLWGLPGFPEAVVSVSRRRGGTRRRSALVRVHEPRLLAPHHVTTRAAIPVTVVARTLIDLAGRVHPGRLERVLDTALSRKLTSLVELREMSAELAERGRGGSTLIRQLLADRHEGYVPPDSGLEARFLVLLRQAGLPEPRRQVHVGGAEWVGRVDLLYARHKVVVEVDSALHHRSKLDREADARRDAALRAAGFHVVRVTDEQVWERPEVAVQLVRAALALPAA